MRRVLFEEILKLSVDEVAAIHSVTTTSGKPCVAIVILDFSMVTLDVDVFTGNASIQFE